MRIVVPSAAVIVAGGAALVLGVAQSHREPMVDANAVTAVPMVSPSSSDGQDQGATALAAAQVVTKTVAAALSGPPGSPGTGDEARPAFDVTRIEPSGEAVIAGRAVPGARVELLRNGELHDRGVADKSGQFVMVPPRLPPGDYELTLRSTLPDGRNTTSRESVVVALQPNLKDQPVVALMTPDKPGVVLSKPVVPNTVGGQVAVDMVETEPTGKLYVSGRSPPGAAVRLYLNDSYRASTTAAADGRFAFTVKEGVRPGGYRVRLDEVESGSGAIRSRAEVPFNMPETVAAIGAGSNRSGEDAKALQPSRNPPRVAKPQDMARAAESQATAAVAADAASPSAVVVPKVTTTVVSRGDSLWRLSRAAYGTGERYSVIYGANHNQIRNPNRIYPGQVFILPDITR